MGERKFQKEDRGRKYHRVERAHGSFGRSFEKRPGEVGTT
jgi:HSP20 family protein